MTNVLPKKCLEEASTWLLEIESGDVVEASVLQFEQWLNSNDNNRKAWQRVKAFSENLDALPPHLTKDTLSRTQNQRRSVLRSILLLTFASGASYWYAKRERWLSDFRTNRGEQRQEILADGTELLLNSATAIDFSDTLLQIDLQQGELQIRSPSSTSHKTWKIVTPHATITPLGTVFDVRTDATTTTVRVLQDSVEVTLKNGKNKHLSAGQGIRIENGKINALSRAETKRQNAWSQGMLVANNLLLSDFIDEFSRYRSGRIVVDESAKNIRVSGSFPINKTEIVLNMLSTTYGVRIERGLLVDKIFLH